MENSLVHLLPSTLAVTVEEVNLEAQSGVVMQIDHHKTELTERVFSFQQSAHSLSCVVVLFFSLLFPMMAVQTNKRSIFELIRALMFHCDDHLGCRIR